MVNVEMDLPRIMTLPEDIRSAIFNLIPQKETVNLRLVCKTWNQEIQDNYEYDIKELDEDSTDFNSILKLRIKNLEIHRLEITPVLNFDDGTCIFKHPNAIQKLVISGGYSFVAQLNLHQLIGLVSKNLQVLDVHFDAKICNYRFPSDLRFNFKQLKQLSIYEIEDDPEKYEENPRSLFHVLKNSSFSNLKILDVNLLLLANSNMTPKVKGRIVGNILRLILKQGKYLEKILVDFRLDSQLIKLPLQEKDLLCMKQIQTLKKVCFDLRPVSSEINQFWDKFLRNQKQLEEVQIYGFSPIDSMSIIQQMTLNNSTLNILYIQDIHLSPADSPFDLSVFQNCVGLKVLILKLDYKAMIARKDLENPDVVNFPSLPQNLITLKLDNFKILSVEVLIAFRSNNTTAGAKGFKKLQELSLMSCGNQGRFGVNGVVFYEIMITPRPSLTNVDFQGGVHKEESGLKTVLSQLQLSDYIYDYFRLKRNSGELGWNFF